MARMITRSWLVLGGGQQQPGLGGGEHQPLLGRRQHRLGLGRRQRQQLLPLGDELVLHPTVSIDRLGERAERTADGAVVLERPLAVGALGFVLTIMAIAKTSQ